MKQLLSVLFILIPSFLYAREQAVIHMKTNKEKGRYINLLLKSTTDSTTVMIDYGDGIPVARTLEKSSILNVVSDVIKGSDIKVYAKKTDITGIFCGQNQLTYLDVSACSALSSLDCSSNMLTFSSLFLPKNISTWEMLDYSNQPDIPLKEIYEVGEVIDLSKEAVIDDVPTSYRWYVMSGTFKEGKDYIIENGKTTFLREIDDVVYCELRNKKFDRRINKNVSALGIRTTGIWIGGNGNIQLTGEMELVASMSAPKRMGAPFEILLQPTENNAAIQIDYGDGIKREAVLSKAKEWYQMTNKLNGRTVRIYAKKNALWGMDCSNQEITNINVSNSSALHVLVCSMNKLDSLDVSQNSFLSRLVCKGNKLTSLDISNNPDLNTLDCRGNQLTSLSISQRKIRLLDCSQNQISTLDCTSLNDLTELYCNSNKLDELNVSQNTKLTNLNCSSNLLSRLDIGSNTNLEELGCSYNRITDLTVSENTKLKELNCSHNQISDLDISTNTALKSLYCSGNNLKTLDAPIGSALEKLSCFENQLISLDISQCHSLQYVDCGFNQMNQFKVSRNNSLTTLKCYRNNLSTLDVSLADSLKVLACDRNALKELDLSNNHALTTLDCSDNQIQTLNLSGITALLDLDLSDNEVKSIDVSASYKLRELDCSKNQLKVLDLSQNSDLIKLDCYYNDLTASNVIFSKDPETMFSIDYSRQGKHKYDRKKSPELGAAIELCYIYKFLNRGLGQGFIGLDIAYSTDEKRPYSGYGFDQFMLGLGGYFGSYNGENKIIPAVNFTYSKGYAGLFDFKVSATPYAIGTSVGINAFNMIKLDAGYNFGYKKINDVDMTGITISLSIFLGGRPFYVDLSN